MNQNQVAYDAAVAELAGRADIAAFIQKVEAMGPGCKASVSVNSCMRFWSPGAAPDYSIYISLVRQDGANLLSYNGGGSSPEEAIAKADSYLRAFILDLIRDRNFLYSIEDVAERRAQVAAQAARQAGAAIEAAFPFGYRSQESMA